MIQSVLSYLSRGIRRWINQSITCVDASKQVCQSKSVQYRLIVVMPIVGLHSEDITVQYLADIILLQGNYNAARHSPVPPHKVLFPIKGDTIIAILDMDYFPPERDIMRDEIKSWKAFACILNNEHEKREFESMVDNYCVYSRIIIDAGSQSIPSKPLVMSLLFSQYREIMQWLINKTIKN